MIEFKADCGHTVRARDEDAGGVVRCSYCGRNANVPDNFDADLDFLFRDVEPPAAPEKRRRRWRRKTRSRRPGDSSEAFDPFAVIFKLCYAAALIAIVVVVARKWVLPMLDEDSRSRRLSAQPVEADAEPNAPARRERERGGPGLIHRTDLGGLYVGSAPEGAAAYCVEESKAPETGRILHAPGVRQFRANGASARVADGVYVVEVAFPWNDPRLSNPRLSDYRNYVAFRKAIEAASCDRRKALMEVYFIPDEAAEAFVDETADQIYLVRQYRGIEVRQARSSGVRALFLPKIVPTGRETFSAEPLINGYLPASDAYRFDEAHVRNELAFYGVPVTEQPFVLQALARVGAFPYVTRGGRTRLFKIGLHDGAFAAKLIREAEE